MAKLYLIVILAALVVSVLAYASAQETDGSGTPVDEKDMVSRLIRSADPNADPHHYHRGGYHRVGGGYHGGGGGCRSCGGGYYGGGRHGYHG